MWGALNLLLLITGAEDTQFVLRTHSLCKRDRVEDVFVGLLQPWHRDPFQEEKSSFLPQ